MSDRRALVERPDPDVAELRVEPPGGWVEDHFCPRCDCTKSRWADMPNMTAEWCLGPGCACHQEGPAD